MKFYATLVLASLGGVALGAGDLKRGAQLQLIAILTNSVTSRGYANTINKTAS